jgi:2-polyprenyl-3-methyl-5-hydroxy-6-metoxy-1,4-benzoquinol methylase
MNTERHITKHLNYSQNQISEKLATSPGAAEIDYYDSHADEYCRLTVGLDMSRVYERFLSELMPGSHILDAGCGSGRDTRAFLQRGYFVTAFDRSPRIAQLASIHSGQQCSVLQFQEMRFRQEFDGVWACASLLHVPKCEMKDVLRRFVNALKPGGLMYVSFIEGEGERVSPDGRRYNSYTAESLANVLGRISVVRQMTCWKSGEILSSAERAPWLNCLFKTAVR